mmetsp:Transcript_41543/g.134692  ORF Transcript_41543/g.134692 Transcript_41543/m.134692 type:complete len:246 (+) Transcript_41543:248-985(+)
MRAWSCGGCRCRCGRRTSRLAARYCGSPCASRTRARRGWNPAAAAWASLVGAPASGLASSSIASSRSYCAAAARSAPTSTRSRAFWRRRRRRSGRRNACGRTCAGLRTSGRGRGARTPLSPTWWATQRRSQAIRSRSWRRTAVLVARALQAPSPPCRPRTRRTRRRRSAICGRCPGSARSSCACSRRGCTRLASRGSRAESTLSWTSSSLSGCGASGSAGRAPRRSCDRGERSERKLVNENKCQI